METSQITLSFANISGKMIEADFDGGTTTSDGGALLLRQAEARTGIVDRIVAAMSDRRHQSYIDHTYTDLIRQRVFQIACGYEDANDSDDLRCDPGLKTACDRLPLTGDDLASQPTMSRLENSVSRSDLYRIGLALLEIFIESYDQPPKKLTIDIDDTDDPTHGAQQLTLFHAYYDEYCYLPVHLYEGKSGKLITTLLRPGRRMRGREAAAILKRVLDHLIMVWPKTKITLRGDSHFSTPEVHDLCDGYGIDFILGQAINNKLKALGEPLMELAAALAEQTDEPVRLFDRFEYQAKSWPRPRQIIYKAEITQGKANPTCHIRVRHLPFVVDRRGELEMMSTNNGKQVSVSEEGPERSGGPSTAASLTQKYRKRPSAGSSEYKLGILTECAGPDRGVAAPRGAVFFAPDGMAARSSRGVAEGAGQATRPEGSWSRSGDRRERDLRPAAATARAGEDDPRYPKKSLSSWGSP